VRSHAKASSAGSTYGQAARLGHLALLLLVTLAAAACVHASSAFAAKEVINYIGPTGSSFSGAFASEFSSPRGIAVNTTGVGVPQGTFYVADDDNHRIQRFDSDGKFVAAWGKDVIASTVNERQRIVVNASAGSYTLSFNGSTSAPIDPDASSSQVDDALDVLPSIGGDANVTVSGGSGGSGTASSNYTVVFTGALAASNQPQIVADAGLLTGSVKITTFADGTATTSSTGTDFEICAVAAECKAGVASGGNGTMAGNGTLDNPQSVAVDGDTGNVYVTDRDNHRVNVYSPTGGFLFSVGRDVQEPDGGTAVEICSGATDTCRQGDGGSGSGEIGSTETEGVLGIAISPPDGNAATGTIYVADSQNRRVVTYGLDGTAPASFGSSSNFATRQPRKIAVDSRGIVYASDADNGGEVERYDSLDANGNGVGFLTPIAASIHETQRITFTEFYSETPEIADRFTLTCPNGSETEDILFNFGFSLLGERVLSALEASCGVGNFVVVAPFSGNFLDITFVGSFETTNAPTTVCTPLPLPGHGGTCGVTAETDGVAATLLPGSGAQGTGSATSGLAVDPDSDGGGADEDVLYVLRDPSFGNTVVQQFGPDNDPGATTAPAADDDRHGAGAGFGNTPFSSVLALGLNSTSGQLFVSGTENIGGLGSAHRVYVLADPASIPAPALTVNPITVKGETTATFSATVDPMGGPVNCKFQYSTDQVSWADLPEPDCVSLLASGGPQAISRKVAGLDPNTHYFVRLVVSRPFISNSTTTSFVKFFDTLPGLPVVSNVGAVQVTDASARMVGTVDPRHSATGYVFEYGTTPALGSSTAPLDIGAGTTPITLSQVVGGLKKDTTYYFRLVATNAFGAIASNQKTLHTRTDPLPPANPGNCPNEAVRQEQSSTFLPDCRAYEMVSPSDKNQGSAGGVGAFGGEEVRATFSRDGSGVVFCTGSVFADPPSQLGLTCAPYLSRRGASGWSTVNPLPTYCIYDALKGSAGLRMAWFSPESFDRVAVAMPEFAGCATSPLVAGAPLNSSNVYRSDLSTSPVGLDLLSREPEDVELLIPPFLGGGSADFSHVVWASYTNQTPDSPTPVDTNILKLYDWEEEGHGDCIEPGGCLSLISVDPNGNPFTTQSRFPGYVVGVASVPIPGYVSEDGNRIYFINSNSSEGEFGYSICTQPTCNVYLREDGTTTLHVGASECTTNCGVESSPESFLWASPSGDKALIESCAKLTDASNEAKPCVILQTPGISSEDLKLYRWDRNEPEGHRLVDLSIDNEPADGSQPKVVDIIGTSSDEGADPASNAAPGNTVYFVAQGQLVSGEPAPFVAGETVGMKLYRWRWNNGNPSLDYLGNYRSSLDDGSQDNDSDLESDPNANRRHVRVTPDGRYLVIQTRLALDPVGDGDGDGDLYRWSEAEGWLCVSCQLPEVPSAGHVTSFTSKLLFNTLFFEIGGQLPEHTISEDGQRVFFTTPDALVPEDVNGEAGCPLEKYTGAVGESERVYRCADLYEWHDGTVSLLSSGTSAGAVVLLGATADGEDVFFSGPQRLVGWDLDNSTDIYDVRSEGGFPEPAAQPPVCEGEACRGAGITAPATSGAGTAVFEGPGDVTRPPGRTCPKGKRTVTRKGKARCVKRSPRNGKGAQRKHRIANHDRRVSR
jgi:NHL repeat-containing protein